jgi:hypothetical protein
MPNTPRFKACPGCGRTFDTCRRFRKCFECAADGHGGPLGENKPTGDEGWLYFIGESGLTSFVKIGFTKYPPAVRLKQLQTGNPRKLMLLYYRKFPDVMDVESRLHERFDEDRVEGEWFRLSKALRDYLIELRQDEHPFE